ncbi:uncharacterized protein LOC127115211 [Lathyrus oleraceus]|uniref:DNL-type domain-containing protein n=2 Tax=Pisum sativum TaxID=3888 RepID=A0A9D5H0B5_PEA|nr:uncharacterized protein LOC127115211 [Pisum sativum]KAI5447930.1 hypothetical protein KIW84_015393 [Pisum sativum]
MGLVLSAATGRGWTTGSGMEGPPVPAVGKDDQFGTGNISTFPWSLFTKSPRRRMLIAFTCTICGQRTTRAINPHAYNDGTVFVQIFLYSIAWSSWVPYALAGFSVLGVLVRPTITSIASKQVGPNEQGMVQGCLSGITSVANIISPLIFSPLTALFLSEDAPFNFPGFSLMCLGLILMTAFFLSLMIRAAPPIVGDKVSSNRCTDTLV